MCDATQSFKWDAPVLWVWEGIHGMEKKCFNAALQLYIFLVPSILFVIQISVYSEKNPVNKIAYSLHAHIPGVRVRSLVRDFGCTRTSSQLLVDYNVFIFRSFFEGYL